MSAAARQRARAGAQDEAIGVVDGLSNIHGRFTANCGNDGEVAVWQKRSMSPLRSCANLM
jgi:hypothetical protein